MRESLGRICRLTVASALALALIPVAVAAQSELDASEAEAFMGEWDVPIVSDMGALNVSLSISEQDGKVAVSVGSPELGGAQEVTNVERREDRLVLTYDVDVEGQYVDVVMTFTPEGEELKFTVDAAGGAFFTSGTATRAGS